MPTKVFNRQEGGINVALSNKMRFADQGGLLALIIFQLG